MGSWSTSFSSTKRKNSKRAPKDDAPISVVMRARRRFLDIDTVRELLNESTKMTWEKVKPMAEDVRKQLNQRKSGEYVPVYQWWEYLYNELQKREQTLQAKQ